MGEVHGRLCPCYSIVYSFIAPLAPPSGSTVGHKFNPFKCYSKHHKMPYFALAIFYSMSVLLMNKSTCHVLLFVQHQ